MFSLLLSQQIPVINLSWSSVTNITVTNGNDLQSTALNARGQADQILVGDGYVQFTTALNNPQGNNCIMGLSVLSGQTAWTLFNFNIFYFSADGKIYSGLDGVNTSSGVSEAASDILRIRRVGTDMKFSYIRAGIETVFRTVNSVTTVPLYIKVDFLPSGSFMLDTLKGV